MSLVRLALRIAAVQALRGRTDVGDNVLDSEFGVLATDADGNVRVDQTRPFIAVYTDAAKAGDGEGAPAGSALDLRTLTINGATELILVVGITGAMVEVNPSTRERTLVGMGVPAIDRNIEAQLDIIVRQACDVLTDPAIAWAEVFRALIKRFIRVERACTSSIDGQRMAAHQVKIIADLVADPVKGEELRATSSLARFLLLADAIENDPDTAAQLAAMRACIAGVAFDWETEQRRRGLTRPEMDALLLAPAEGAEADVTVVDVNVSPAELS